jgi:NADPH2:quinone reductase
MEGAGGVGHVGLQLAKLSGAKVAASVGSTEAAALAAEFGSDATINYREESVPDYVKRLMGGNGFSAVFDTVGSPGASIRSRESAWR